MSDSVTDPLGSKSDQTESAQPAPPLPTPHVPDHELIKRIGRGAYGEVWLARSITGAYRAVKIVTRSSFDHERPFEREFEGILKFEPISRQHDSQVDILHVGRGDGYFYYVMELADDVLTGGQINPDNYSPRTLKSDVLQRVRIPFEECVQIGIALTTALENLHENGLVHRDVKPSNIIFVNGVPKLADIGLVAGVDATHTYVGTEGFAAPEGSGTAQADLYSLGKVLYEIATGKDRQEFPELPTQLRELPDREGLIELNAVIARACRHNPADRYTSATEMRADLELLQSGKSLARLHRIERRLRFVTRAAVVVTVLTLFALGAWFYQARQTRIVRELANANSRLASEKSKLAEENREQVVRLDVANGVRVMDAGDITGSLLWFAEALPLVTNIPPEESIHRIRIQQILNQTPRLLQVMPHESRVQSSSLSPDGHRVATVTWDDYLRVWDVQTGKVILEVPKKGSLQLVRFTRDGRRLFISSSRIQGGAAFDRMRRQLAEIVDAESGKAMFPSFVSNLICSALSPDDRWFAVALTNHVIRLLDARNGETTVDLIGHADEITMLSFSRDGSLIASASLDQTVRLWRLPSGELACPPLQHDYSVKRAIFSPDNLRVATATANAKDSTNCFVQMWDIQTGTTVGPQLRALNYVFALAFDDTTGRRLLTGDDEFMARVWDTETHLERLPPLRMDSVVRCWAFSPDGHCVAIGSDGGDVRIWSLDSGDLLFPPFRHADWVESLHFSPDGKRLLTTSDDGTAKLWDLSPLSEPVRRLQLPRTISKFDPNKFPAALSPDRRRLLVGTDEPTVRLINVQTMGEEGDSMPVPAGARVRLLEFDNTGHQWAAACSEGSQSVTLWRQEGNGVRHFALPHGGPAIDLRFTPDRKMLVTLSEDEVMRTWNTEDGSSQREVRMPEGYQRALLSDDARLVILSSVGESRLFDIKSESLIGQPFRPGLISAVRFSPDGGRFATANGGGQTARIWDAATGKPLTPPFKHGGYVGSVDWSPDGRRLVTAGNSSKAKIWDTATGELLLSPLAISKKGIQTAHWSLDGRFIVTRSNDNLARVWDAATAEAVTPLLKHEGFIFLARLTANNRLITLSDPPNVLRAWDLTETRLPVHVITDYARLLSGRKLGPAGDLQPLSAKELGDLAESLRSRSPELFVEP